MPLLLGIDNGLTVTKAVIFDEAGKVLASSRRRVKQVMPQPRHVERDMDALWAETAAAIAEAVAACGRPPSEIAAVSVTAHGDGLYLLDSAARPLGPGILSLDSRAEGVAGGWQQDGTAACALARTGQTPHASAPATLLSWIAQADPARFARIAHVISCKDWLRFCLTGQIATDLTDASASFTDVAAQVYAADILPLFGLERLQAALPPVLAPDAVAGRVTARAAALTGLCAGTPVAAGLHDVTASALGSGGYGTGTVAIVAGTYSINETVSTAPKTDPRWFCRNGIAPGEWNNMAISPASATNYDWFLDHLCAVERRSAEAEGRDIHAELTPEIEAAMARPSSALFHPFLFGSPYGAGASASFFGLRGWQDRGDMLRAVVEGIAFNHRIHVDALREGFAPEAVRMTGGISRSPLFAQLFADVLGMEVETSQTEEAAAWGAALCAGASVGLFASPRHDPRGEGGLARHYRPDAARHAALNTRYALFNDLTRALTPLWPRVDALATGG